jgi:peptidoglycan/xylan/chitin deacetylase (PgdA/CDA1 family)
VCRHLRRPARRPHLPHTARGQDTRRLLATLAATDRTVGFVNENKFYREEDGGRLDEERVRLLNLWLDAGHELGTQTTPTRTSTSRSRFQQDVIRGEEITGKLMSERGMRPRYFSYPYLNTGPDRETKEAAEAFSPGAATRFIR